MPEASPQAGCRAHRLKRPTLSPTAKGRLRAALRAAWFADVTILTVTSSEWLLFAVALTAAAYLVFILCLLIAGRRRDARALAGFIPDCLVLVRRLIADDRVPRRSKLLLGALLVYLASPIDLVPDYIPVAGQLDDAIVVAFALRNLLRTAGPNLLLEHWPGPTASLNLLTRLAGRSNSR